MLHHRYNGKKKGQARICSLLSQSKPFAASGKAFAVQGEAFAAPEKPFAASEKPLTGRGGPFAASEKPLTGRGKPYAASGKPFADRGRPFEEPGRSSAAPEETQVEIKRRSGELRPPVLKEVLTRRIVESRYESFNPGNPKILEILVQKLFG